MRFEASPQLRLSSQLRMAPRMIQAMEMLQLASQELRERVEQELQENPALELVEPEAESMPGDDDGAEDHDGEDASSVALTERPLEISEDGANFELAREFERVYGEGEDHDGAPRIVHRADEGSADRKMEAMANAPDRELTLSSSLERQWALAEVPEHLAARGRWLIAYANDDGLLGADLETIAAQSAEAPGGPWTAAQLEEALLVAQAFLEPPGLLARDQRESLRLQVGARLAGVPEPPAPDDLQGWRDAETLLRDHYDDLLANRIPQIVERSGLDFQRIADAKRLLRRLSLAPGSDLVSRRERPIVPDVIVEYDRERDDYVCTLADGTVPSLRIAEQYREMVKDRRADPETRRYLTDRIRSAKWLIDALEQRQATLLRVVTAVVARQREWFDAGPEHLKPLPMGDIADQLGIHVATVSRAVAGKWLSTPRGLVELRRFFTGGLETRDGASMSFEAIRTLLREVIDGEDKHRPLSDEAIAKVLRERGVDIARRTVVKYRDQLGIPAAKLRKLHELPARSSPPEQG
ncbi:MAG: RNA polymerase factor sigma-54 [Phycisphaeraceae bacterium]|nr:RNA polymerase factor sigma-54 [Phycisphaeraceae bacterium]